MLRGVALLLVLLVGCHEAHDPAGDLEDRLLAPCCWRQSLRDHESPVATELRSEIRARVAAGETTSAIEADLVGRYGVEIRALPSGKDPRWMIGAVVGAGVLGGLVVLAVILRRRRPSTAIGTLVPSLEDPDDTDRLDDELARVD